ncbi:hypothetical protein C1I63_00700 [Rathayibacter caricis DSM 15933]|uniref:Flavodoxin-like domain-containing protein n=1 Tax=Rathayibacter caricis DSM 15933 TaxID=1328867 RepID=A0A2T4UPS4_9MICO|nr:hypothetical protein [Rathayibacter caricis]PTL71521.1 hypothetical protein C1I63_00700 [Rathayibacter caricis DSM 15933]
MRALVVDESQFGTTHRIAEAIGRGLAETLDVEVVDVNAALRLEGVDLLVVGGAAHVRGLSSPRAPLHHGSPEGPRRRARSDMARERPRASS